MTVLAGSCAVASACHSERRRRSRVVCHAKASVKPGEKVVGIDLGTTNSAIAVLEGGKATVIPNAEGQRTTPSVVAYAGPGTPLVGQTAKRQAAVNPKSTFSSVKRFIGREPGEVEEEISEVSYEVEASPNGRGVVLKCPKGGRLLSPEDVSAQVLRKLAYDAGRFLGKEVTKAVVTVPAYFNDSQRQATKDAGTIAGLEVLRIVNEPTAASLAYGLDKRNNETILVFDLGGGTFDVSVLIVGDGLVEVLATSGDTHLGGDDFDKRIVDWLVSNFKLKEGVDLMKDPQARQRLNEAAEKAKIELSDVQQVTISLPFITIGDWGRPLMIEETLTRRKFEELCADLIERCRGPVKQALEDAKLQAKDLDEVVLVGGSTRIPAVKALARELSGGKDPNQSVNPDEVVALGAAVQGAILTGEVKDIVLLDVIPLSLSIKTNEGLSSIFLPRNTRVPAKKTKMYSTYRDNQLRVIVDIVQGERKLAKDNKSLGTFYLEGIAPAPRGVPQIEVTFDVDSNGILSVSALDKATMQAQSVTIASSSTLAPEDVEKKVKDAKEAAAQEAYTQGILTVKNEAEAAAYAAERACAQGRYIMKKEQAEIIESKILLVRAELMKDNLDIPLLQVITADLEVAVKDILALKAKEQWDIDQGFKQRAGKPPIDPMAQDRKKATL